MHGPIVCLVNRTEHDLRAVKDGKVLVLKPGDNWINSDWVRYAKAQNMVPGTRNYSTLEAQFLVGLRGTSDAIDTIPDDVLATFPIEGLDRSALPLQRQQVVERSHAFPRGRAGTAIDHPTESFTGGPVKFGGE